MKGLSAAAKQLEKVIDALGTEISSFTQSLLCEFDLSDLHEQRIFLPWKEVMVGKAKRKVPFNANNYTKAGSSANRETWSSYKRAHRSKELLLSASDVGGVGVMLGVDTGLGCILVGFDLDSVIDEVTGEISLEAQEVVQRFNTRAEISPGKLGIKLFGYVPFDELDQLQQLAGMNTKGMPRTRVDFSRGKHEEIAFDWKSRYYTVTNDFLCGTTEKIRRVSLENIRWFIKEMGPRYLGGVASSRRKLIDKSGSGIAYRFALAQYRAGKDEEATLDALLEDDGPAGEWAGRSDDRQLERVVANASAFYKDKGKSHDGTLDPEASSHPDIARLNRRHAVTVISGKTLVATFADDGSVEFGSEKDLHLRYANDLVPTADGKKYEQISKQWLQHADRRFYPGGLGFYPGSKAPKGQLNLWTGWVTYPDQYASCNLILQHLEEIICAGDTKLYIYLLGYLAHAIQNPCDKPGVALVFRGKKGAGKDTVAEYMECVLGDQYVRPVSQANHVTGQFNSRLETTFILNVQEALWAGDHRGEAVLKTLITSPRIEIERKGINSYSMRNFVRLLITANAEWVVPASRDERRYAVFEVSDKKIGDKAYFDALRAEMEGDGPHGLHHFLLHHDLSTFDVRKPPFSSGLFRQKLESLRNFDRWWFEVLFSGSISDQVSEDWEATPITIDREDFQREYETWWRKQRHQGAMLLPNRVGEVLRDLCNIESSRPSRQGMRVWTYRLPRLDEARAQFEDYMDIDVDWTP